MLVEKLLFSVIQDNDITTLFKTKDEFVQPKERAWLEYAKDFYALYQKLPDIQTVEGKFSIQLIDNTESATYWHKEVVDKYQEHIIEQAIINSAKNKGKALDLFQQAILDYNVDMDSKIADYSDGARRAQEYKDRKGTGGITYLSTGLQEIDDFSMGYKKTDLWTLGGREGVGKSWKLLRMADAVDQWMLDNNINKNILIVSGEMGTAEFEERLDAIRCEMSYDRLSRGELTAGEERKYNRYLTGFDSNIRIVDSFDGLKDIDYFMTLYRPAITFIDGSHLLSPSYDWGDIAKVTSTMKKMTRNKKIPIVNTTHLKADKGKSSTGGNLDDFAYTKGYTRDSDIVGVMFASDIMELENKIGIDWAKVRRGNRTQTIWQNDRETCKEVFFESKIGIQLATAGGGGNAGASSNGNGGVNQLF